MNHEPEAALHINSSSVRRVAAALLAIGLSALALGACGGAADSAAAGDTAAERDAARLKLTQCLRDNGVDLPDNRGQGAGGGAGTTRPSAADREKVREAMNGACKAQREAAFGDITEADRQERQDQFQQFAQCMRDNGVDLPDRTIGGAGGPPTGGTRIDRDDPDVQAAQKTCQDKRPQGGGLRGGAGR